MKFRFIFLFAFIIFNASIFNVSAQVDSIIGQISDAPAETFVTGISGDGRFVVMESTGNIATENPRNADGNREVFLFDYAQRRIFQITDTKSLLTDTTKPVTFDNIKVDIINQRPVISHDGRWIAFSSNATYAYPGNGTNPPIVSDSNPGNFDANSFTPTSGTNNLVNDGNTEIWLYELPAVTSVNLSAGTEIPYANLNSGTFTRVTNSLPSRVPLAGTSTTSPVIADDNRDVSINDNGNALAFVSNRDLQPCTGTGSATCGNAPDFDNPEIFTFARNAGALRQVTFTPRGTVLAPIYNLNPNISGDGLRVSFLSNGNNPIKDMSGGSNSDRSDEIFVTNLDTTGVPSDGKRQITQTTGATSSTIVNIFSYGKRMSRDGRFIAFESIADLTNENGGNNYAAVAVFVYDYNAATNSFRRIGPRGDADSGATGGDVLRFPTFTDYDAGGTPSTVLLTTRLNITAAGIIPTTAADGLNSASERPPQIYSYQLSQPSATATFTRLTKFPATSIVANTQTYASNTFRRTAFTLAQVELGTGNFDRLSESYYLLIPVANQTVTTAHNFFTGASRLAVSTSPTPTPSPSPTPTASPSPTPQTPATVLGISPGMLAIVNLTTEVTTPAETTAVGSINRRFQLPIELGGVTMSINGATAGLKKIAGNEITFVVPQGLVLTSVDGDNYPYVINNNGRVIKGEIRIIPSRPDIFTTLPVPGPNGRARAQNVTNRVPLTEPFIATTVKIKGGRRVNTIIRLYTTGIAVVSSNFSISVQIGSKTITVPITATNPTLVEPGVYALDFPVSRDFNGLGDQPVVITVTIAGTTYKSRLEDTAPRMTFL